MKRLGILLSGRGSNFLAIADSIASGKLNAEIAVVISNRADAAGITAARDRGFNAVVLPSKGVDRDAYGNQLIAELEKARVDLICLAGYMRLLSPAFIRRFFSPDRLAAVNPQRTPPEPRASQRRTNNATAVNNIPRSIGSQVCRAQPSPATRPGCDV